MRVEIPSISMTRDIKKVHYREIKHNINSPTKTDMEVNGKRNRIIQEQLILAVGLDFCCHWWLLLLFWVLFRLYFSAGKPGLLSKAVSEINTNHGLLESHAL